MNEQPSGSEAEPISPEPPPVQSTGEPLASQPRRALPRLRGLPRWLPLLGLAVVPAFIVGAIVFALRGGGSADRAAGVLDGFIYPNVADEGTLDSLRGKLPAGFPKDFPQYRGADIVASFTIDSGQGLLYLVIYNTSARPNDVASFYQQKLDADPWQVEAAQIDEKLSRMLFSRPDNADVQGDISIHRSDLDGRTSIFVSYQDLAATRRGSNDTTFSLGPSRTLPPGFPSDVPIYKGKEASTVTETFFQRGSGTTTFIITFLTKNSQDDVVDFYRDAFEKKGWTVTDSAIGNRGFQISIDFSDGSAQEIQGSIRADSFEDDASYTKVDMLLQVSSRRNRGN